MDSRRSIRRRKVTGVTANKSPQEVVLFAPGQTPQRLQRARPGRLSDRISAPSNQFRLLIMCIELHIVRDGPVVRRQINTLISSAYRVPLCWLLRCTSRRVPANSGQGPGCHLTNLNHSASIASANLTDTPATPKKHGWLPLLTVLFLISYGLMTMLIVEQGQTIESQRALIRELFRDSRELSAVKKAQQESIQSPSAKTQAPLTRNRSSQNPSTQNSLTQNPSTQAPVNQAPSSQAGPQHGAQNRAAKQKPQVRMPSKPASDLVDDVRTLVTI